MKELVIDVLEKASYLMELAGENFFKIRAFRNAIRALQMSNAEFDAVVAADGLREIPGIGAGIEEVILSIVKTGTADIYETLQQRVPIGLLELFKIPGLGAKRIRRLHEELDITNLGELEYACEENRLLTLPGFGEKSQANILKGISELNSYKGSFLYPTAYAAAQELLAEIRLLRPFRCELTGALRRAVEIVGQIEILAAGISPKQILSEPNIFLLEPKEEKNTITGQTRGGIPVILHFSDAARWGTDLILTTGNKLHLDYLLSLAKTKSASTNQPYLPEKPEEADVYNELGLDFILPELREGLFEVPSDEGRKVSFPQLVTHADFKGVFHVHTTYSDGIATLEEISQHGRTLGYSYVGIADHSQSAFYANGLKRDDLLRQMAEIGQINAENPDITLLKGLEVDILSDGSLDCDDNLLKKLDYVIASVHSNFRMSEKDMTNRVIKALSNPHVTMLGHPTGRLLLARRPYPIDLDKVIEACHKYQVAIEINASPRRLDLDWRWARKAYEKGVMLVVNPDAHRLAGFAHTQYGINAARKAGLPKNALLNTRELGEFKWKN
ncbi:MAG: histidinol-phosphatase [Firmicutes bacterium]|nr:histidinol-phosphatase [Bacillota bacterium]